MMDGGDQCRRSVYANVISYNYLWENYRTAAPPRCPALSTRFRPLFLAT
jgi:hypothetical protein